MTLFLTIIHVIVCFVLILVILLQAGRGQGLTGSSFSSGNVQSLFGTGAADFLTKATSVCAICFLFTSIGLGYVESHKSRTLMQFSKKSAPMDIDSIKKALERVKQEQKDSAVTKAVNAAPAASATTAANAQEQVKTAVAAAAATAQQAAAQAPAVPAETAKK